MKPAIVGVQENIIFPPTIEKFTPDTGTGEIESVLLPILDLYIVMVDTLAIPAMYFWSRLGEFAMLTGLLKMSHKLIVSVMGLPTTNWTPSPIPTPMGLTLVISGHPGGTRKLAMVAVELNIGCKRLPLMYKNMSYKLARITEKVMLYVASGLLTILGVINATGALASRATKEL
jgi:hypothetical protein